MSIVNSVDYKAMNEYGAIGGMRIVEENKSTRRIPATKSTKYSDLRWEAGK
jgi:hypothetical protein